MGPRIVYRHTAFKHRGVTQKDIEWAFQTARYDEIAEIVGMEEQRDKHLLLGFDTRGNPLEVMYNDFGDTFSVFHAMACRDEYLPLMEDGR